jgi:hypothetical protein
MPHLRSAIRKPIRRLGAERYLLVTLLSFAASVAFTRLFLSLTGYPRLGGEGFHIAHVLWGGLALFIAALLPLVFANRWVYLVGAILGGVGVGLFIDEVGKFITLSNDYFYPLAAPIIYVFFLLMVILYLQLKQHRLKDPRSELFAVLDTLEEVIESDMDEGEYQALEERLHFIAGQEAQPELKRFAQVLLTFLPTLQRLPENPSAWDRSLAAWHRFEESHLSPRRLKALLVGGLIALGLVALSNLAQAVASGRYTFSFNQIIEALVTAGNARSLTALFWIIGRLISELIASLLLLVSAVLLLLGKDKPAVFLGNLVLLLYLTMINLVVFYFDQFSTILLACIQFILFLGLNSYNRRFVIPASQDPDFHFPSDGV